MIIDWLRAQMLTNVELEGIIPMPDVPVSATEPEIDPISVRVHVQADRRQCEVVGQVSAKITQLCVRCLTEVVENLDVPFHEVFARGPLTTEQLEADVIQVDGETIDLAPFVRQAIYLALSTQPLCKFDCAGLCPDCGKNRNVDLCDCETRQLDPRLEALSSFYSDSNDAGPNGRP